MTPRPASLKTARIWRRTRKRRRALELRAKLQQARDGREAQVSGESVSFVGLECEGYRLPTEAEWEYGARAGGSHRYSGSDSIDAVAWYRDNSGEETHPVGTKRENGWGLSDMSGNVWEWCGDWYGDYSSGTVKSPTGASSGSGRVERGGAWNNSARNCRSTDRDWFGPDLRENYLGFRLVLTFGQ